MNNLVTIGRHILPDDKIGFMYRRKKLTKNLTIVDIQFRLFKIININITK
jgi:hypothetical protein